MTPLKSFFALSMGCASLLFSLLAYAAAPLEPVTIAYSSFSGAYLPLWIAVEERLGRKHGLDLKAIYAGRIRPQQLLASGEVPFVMATGTGALTSHILGVKDQVIIMTTVNKVNSAIFSRSDIKTPEELRGKVIATGRPGAFGDMMVRYVLRAKLGLVPDRDVKMLAIGEAQLAFPALERGIVQAASLTIPFTLIAKKMGYRELVDYDKVGVVYPYNTITTLRQTPVKNPDLTEKVLKTIIEGIHVSKTDKEKSLAVLKKYMKGTSDDILEETYQYAKSVAEEVPTPSLEIVKAALEILSYQYPQAKETDPNLIIDASIMKRIDQSGFIKGLYKK
ncbi:MAG TPA: ABC transporter substrate-binding protein [Candidatus Binatia bacterium]|jgi:ABC-type nitrate/sulfonate/bicarbonate transport system substrate-binding protein